MYYYELYRLEEKEPTKRICYGTFCDTMAKDYPYVKLTNRKKHAKCPDCQKLIDRLRKAMTAAEKEQIAKERKIHWAKVR